MTDRDVHLPVGVQSDLATVVDHAVRAEDLGYDRAWLPETWGRDAITTLALMAERTEEIGIGSGIVNVFSRSPATLGQTAATLQEAADGRFRLGVGPSGPALMEGWHGADFERPLRRTREAVEIIDLVTSGREVDYEGDVFTLSGFELWSDPPDPRPPVDVAAMGPTAVEMAGRFADGWHAFLFSPDGFEERMEDLRRGADLGDRDVDAVRTVLSVPCCALEDGERARRLASQHVAFYVGAMGSYYRDSLIRQGYEAEAREISAAWAAGERSRAAEVVGEELLDEFAAAGTPEHARRKVETFESVDGLDAVAVGFPRGVAPDEVEATMSTLGPV